MPGKLHSCFRIPALIGAWIFATVVALGTGPARGATPSADVHGPETARTAQLPLPARVKADRIGYLGVRVDVDESGKLFVAGLAPDSPGSRAGFHLRDIIERIDGQPVPTPEAFGKVIQLKKPQQTITISVRRANAPLELKATLGSLASAGHPTSRPAPSLSLGFHTGETRPEGGERITSIDPNSPAGRAGLRIGDFILKINQTALDASTHMADALATSRPNELVSLSVLRDGREFEIKTPVFVPGQSTQGRGRGFGRGQTAFKKDVYRIAVIGVEFADVKHNPNVTADDWTREFFSKGEYTGRNATGQPTYGSVNDFYQEISSGAMRVDGTFFDWVQVSRKRMDYYTPPAARGAPSTRPSGAGGRAFRGGAAPYDAELLNDVLEQLATREGPGALSGYDGLIFLYAGARPVRVNGNVFWPHTTGFTYRGQRIMYCIAEEGGMRMSNISLFCHEIGHMLGLPDLYVQREPGSPPSLDAIGLGNWCLMSIQIANGRPQHMCAWSKERLGWIKPAIIDPTVRQHLVLGPIENSNRECFKIPVKPDGSEYLLLENRQRIGFDQSVPSEGLVIWHVVNGRPVLVEAHGLTGPRAPSMNVQSIPYPTPRNDEYTPYSKPSSAFESDDALPVYITHIRRVEGNKIAFDIGYAFN